MTVIALAYNYGRFLDECVQSALTQRDVDVTVLIADDCSTDETPALTARLAASDSRVRVIRNDANLGQIPTINAAFSAVETPYVVKLDADDLLVAGSLARATALLEVHPGVAFVCGRPRHFSGATPQVRDAATRSWTIWAGCDWITRRCRHAVNVISQPEVVMRTECLRRAGPMRESLPHTFDLHMWLRLASIGDVGRVNGPVQALYRVHDASMQRTVNAGVMVDLRGLRGAFAAVLEEDDGGVAGADELLRAALRSLAASALERACRAYDRGQTRELPVDELIAFALETYPDALRLPEWSALTQRRSVGAERAPRDPRFVARALARRSREALSRRRWLRTGEW